MGKGNGKAFVEYPLGSCGVRKVDVNNEKEKMGRILLYLPHILAIKTIG